jgi:hypothetical protein
MTTAPSADDRSERVTYALALMSTRAPVPDGLPPWPGRIRCDLVDVPLDACCGIIAHLERAHVGLCPIAHIGDRMLFLTAVGSSAAHLGGIAGLPAGVLVHGAIDGFPPDAGCGRARSCWVIEPWCEDPVLPSAETVLRALSSAYAEYQTAVNAKIA